MTTITDATPKDIPAIAALAEAIWWPTYRPIISEGQIRYMLDTIYSAPTLSRAMNDGSQRFLLLSVDSVPTGFASFGPREKEADVYKLHKLYVLPQTQGQGLGKLLIEATKERLRSIPVNKLDLNVNRANPALGFYKKLGFKIIYEEDIPIGQYWMNDYVMRLIF